MVSETCWGYKEAECFKIKPVEGGGVDGGGYLENKLQHRVLQTENQWRILQNGELLLGKICLDQN